MKVWAVVGLGRKQYMEKEDAEAFGYEYEEIKRDKPFGGAPRLALNSKLLNKEESRAVFFQTGKHCDNWDDVNKALKAGGSRIIEKGDKIDRCLAGSEGPGCTPEDAEEAEKILTDHIGQS